MGLGLPPPSPLSCSAASYHMREWLVPAPSEGKETIRKAHEAPPRRRRLGLLSPISAFCKQPGSNKQVPGFPNEGIFSSSSNRELEVGVSSGSLADLGEGGWAWAAGKWAPTEGASGDSSGSRCGSGSAFTHDTTLHGHDNLGEQHHLGFIGDKSRMWRG